VVCSNDKTLIRGKTVDNIYNSKMVVFSLVLLYSALFLNFGLSTYMLNGPPILITDNTKNCGGYALAPFIVIDETAPSYYFYTIARHEYQHYMQQAVLTPMIFALSYSSEFIIFGKPYSKNLYEIEAYSKQNDGLIFDVFDLELLKIKTMSKE